MDYEFTKAVGQIELTAKSLDEAYKSVIPKLEALFKGREFQVTKVIARPRKQFQFTAMGATGVAEVDSTDWDVTVEFTEV